MKNLAAAFLVVSVVFLAALFHLAPAAIAVYALATGAPWASTACAVLVLLFVATNLARVGRAVNRETS